MRACSKPITTRPRLPGGNWAHYGADSGFSRNELMSGCENNGVDSVFDRARNQKLRRIIHTGTVKMEEPHGAGNLSPFVQNVYTDSGEVSRVPGSLDLR